MDIEGGPVDTNTLSPIPEGYILTYNVADAAGNNADTETRTVHVTDTLAPTVTLLGPDPQTVEAGSGPYSDPGVTVSDIFDPSPILFVLGQQPPVDYSTIDTSVVATYSVPYIAQDASGNTSAEIRRTVNVVDTTPPILTRSNQSGRCSCYFRSHTLSGGYGGPKRSGNLYR
jgi:hypothetical protein